MSNDLYMKLREMLKTKEQELKGSDDAFAMSLLTFPGYVSSSRGVMYTGHLKHMVTLNESQFPEVMGHYENMLGKLSSGYCKSNDDCKVYAKIPKYSNIPNHKYMLFTYNAEKDFYDVIEKKNVENCTEKFGYSYDNSNIDSKDAGSYIKKDEVLYKTNSYDEFMNYGFGRNIRYIYALDNDTIEDALSGSETLAKVFETTEVDTVKVTLNDNDILCNLYGDNSFYKPIPDIGESINRRILCSKKRIFNNQILYDLKRSNLRKINFTTDTPYYCDGIVEDVDIYCNKPLEEIVETPFNSQLLHYLREQRRYNQEVNDICTSIINSGSNYSKEINYIFKRTSDILNEDYKWRDEDNIFSNMIIEFTISNAVPLDIGSKITGRYGNKGVLSVIKPDSEMPFTINAKGEKEPIHLIINLAGVLNRTNLAQLFEGSITHIHAQFVERFKYGNIPLKQKETEFFKYYELMHAEQHKALVEYYSTFETDARKEQFFDNVVEKGMVTQMSLLVEDEPILFKLMKVYDTFTWLKLHDVYINKWGRDIKSLRKFVVSRMYMIRLKQTSKKGFSARSLAGIGIKNVPEKSNKAKIHQELYAKTPIKSGDQENLNLTIGVNTETIADLHRHYRSSPIARRDMGVRSTSPCELEDFEINPDYRNINSEILSTYLKCIGVKIDFSNDGYEIPIYSSAMNSYEVDNSLFIGDDIDYEREKARKKVEDYYSNNECIVDSVEEYDKFIEMKVDEYLDSKDASIE